MKLLNDVLIGGGVEITDILVGSSSVNLASAPANDSIDGTATLTGAANGDVCAFAAPNSAYSSSRIFTGYASGTNQVTVRYTNTSESDSDLAATTFKWLTFKTA
jgi:hypothetical protein